MVNHNNEGLLRRRGVLEPLAADAERVLQESNVFSTLYISPCQVEVSNDPFSSIPYQDLVPCNLTYYECPSASDAVAATTNISVSYDFELRYKTGADLNITLAALEGSQLQHAAYVTGLLECGAFTVPQFGSRRNLQTAELLTTSEKDALVAISSDPQDTPDLEHTDCIVPVESSVSSGNTCVPIKGYITATVNSSADATVQDGILRGLLKVVRQGMQDDVYVSGNIKKVSFIGTRTDTSNGFATDGVRTADASTEKAGLSGIGIAFLCVGSVLLVALIAMFVRKRQRRMAEERDMIFHDATAQAWKRTLEEGQLGDEGADIPGSLANKDELALRPDPLAPIKTGDLSIDDDPVVPYMSPQRNGDDDAAVLESLNLRENPDRVEYLADTQSFDSTDDADVDESVDQSRDTEAQVDENVDEIVDENVDASDPEESAEPLAALDKLVASVAAKKVVPDIDETSVDEKQDVQ